MRTITLDKWKAEGYSRFGQDVWKWKFQCPSCGHIASAQDWVDAGAHHRHIGFSCVGRWTWIKTGILPSNPFEGGPGPCSYAGDGLITATPVLVLRDDGNLQTFEWAPD